MFSLNSFIDVSEGKPGMLVPLLSLSNTNLPYVQQMDEFFQIREIVPFLEYENYPLAGAEIARTVAIGDNGLIAFRSFDNNIICGNVSEILEYIAGNKELIEKDDILHSQLQRIEAAELNPSYEVWRKVAARVFPDGEQRKFWIDSELSIFQKQKKIWTEIEPIDPDDPSATGSGLYTSISEHSTEYLIRWLSNRKNFVARDWTKIWHYVNGRAPFDERTPEVALNWMFFVGEENREFHQTRSILIVLLDRWRNGYALPDLGEFLSSKFAFDESLLFDFIRPEYLFAGLFEFLTEEGAPDDLFKILEFAVENLPKEEHIIATLTFAVEQLFEEHATAERQRLKLSEMLVALDKAESHLV